MKTKKFVIASMVVILMAAVVLLMASDAGEMRTLKGIQGIRVVVEEIPFEMAQTGLTRIQLARAIEGKLINAGIRVVPQGSTEIPGAPFLYVRITMSQVAGTTLYSYGINVDVEERVALVRNPSMKVFATTYSSGGVGTTGVYALNAPIAATEGYVNDFIIKYAAANNGE